MLNQCTRSVRVYVCTYVFMYVCAAVCVFAMGLTISAKSFDGSGTTLQLPVLIRLIFAYIWYQFKAFWQILMTVALGPTCYSFYFYW